MNKRMIVKFKLMYKDNTYNNEMVNPLFCNKIILFICLLFLAL